MPQGVSNPSRNPKKLQLPTLVIYAFLHLSVHLFFHYNVNMRITGGELKGRFTECPDGIIRPAMDRMRESVFAILGPLEGKSFLDLFSGSGTIAIEAVSRGADRVVLCEKDKLKTRTLIKNVSMTESMGKKIECHFMPVELFLKRCHDQFDFIFCDPPFPYRFHQDLIKIISDGKLLTPTGQVLIHRPAEKDMPDRLGDLIKKDHRIYGRSIVDFYGYDS